MKSLLAILVVVMLAGCGKGASNAAEISETTLIATDEESRTAFNCVQAGFPCKPLPKPVPKPRPRDPRRRL